VQKERIEKEKVQEGKKRKDVGEQITRLKVAAGNWPPIAACISALSRLGFSGHTRTGSAKSYNTRGSILKPTKNEPD
jgi:hypothetical protein